MINDSSKLNAPAKEIVAILNKYNVELIYIDDVFKRAKADIELHTVPCHPKDYKEPLMASKTISLPTL